MKLKALIPALAATGGIATLLFGGTGVSTAFTSSAPGNFGAATATLDTSLLSGGVFSTTGLVPGDVVSHTVVLSNNSTNPVDIVLQFGTLVDSANLAPYIDLIVPAGVPNIAAGSYSLAYLATNVTGPSDLGTLAPGANLSIGFELSFPETKLSAAAENALAGQSVSLPYTFTSTVESVNGQAETTKNGAAPGVGGWSIITSTAK